jgi:hypothetical protein
VRAEALGGTQGHAGENTKLSRFVGRRGYDAAATRIAADDDGLADKLRASRYLYRNEESIEVHVKDLPCHDRSFSYFPGNF